MYVYVCMTFNHTWYIYIYILTMWLLQLPILLAMVSNMNTITHIWTSYMERKVLWWSVCIYIQCIIHIYIWWYKWMTNFMNRYLYTHTLYAHHIVSIIRTICNTWKLTYSSFEFIIPCIYVYYMNLPYYIYIYLYVHMYVHCVQPYIYREIICIHIYSL